MFGLRFAALAVITYMGWQFGQVPPSELNAFGTMFAYAFWIAAPTLYMLPTIEAEIRKSKNVPSIAIINVFLGWSIVGWVAAAAWAFTNSVSEVRTCPFCAEQVKADAIKCKHCFSDLPAQPLIEANSNVATLPKKPLLWWQSTGED